MHREMLDFCINRLKDIGKLEENWLKRTLK